MTDLYWASATNVMGMTRNTCQAHFYVELRGLRVARPKYCSDAIISSQFSLNTAVFQHSQITWGCLQLPQVAPWWPPKNLIFVPVSKLGLNGNKIKPVLTRHEQVDFPLAADTLGMLSNSSGLHGELVMTNRLIPIISATSSHTKHVNLRDNISCS